MFEPTRVGTAFAGALAFGLCWSVLLWTPAWADAQTIRVPGEDAIENQHFDGVLKRDDIRLYQFLGRKGQTLTITFRQDGEVGYSLLDLVTKRAILVEQTGNWTGPLPTDGSYSLNTYAMWPKDMGEDVSATYDLGIDVK